MPRRLVVACCLLLAAGGHVSAAAQGRQLIKARVDHATVNAGDSLVYLLEVMTAGEKQASPDIHLPDFGSAFQVRDVFTRSSVNILNGRTYILNYKEAHLTATEPGDHVVPPGRVVFVDAESGAHTEEASNPVPVKVNQFTGAAAVATPTPQIDVLRPIKDRAHVSLSQWLPWGIALTLSFLIIGATLVARRRPAVEPEPAPVDPRSPEERALEELEQARRLKEAGKVPDFYTRLSQILRHYLAEVFHIHAEEATTREILEQLTAQGIDTEFLEAYRRAAAENDRVKFASYLPSTDQVEEAYREARDLVHHPWPPETGEPNSSDTSSEPAGSAPAGPAGKS